MSDHIKRGATKYTNREVTYDGLDDDPINSVWCCQECNEPLELRQRGSEPDYTEIGCACGAESLELRIADILDFKMETWDTVVAHKLGRGDL